MPLHRLEHEVEFLGLWKKKRVVQGYDIWMLGYCKQRLLFFSNSKRENVVLARDESRSRRARTSSSLSFLHSSQPSHFLFMHLTATRRIFAYSGRVPTTVCIADTGVLGGRGPCQSQSQTVPKDPSPKALMGVKERTDAVGD